MPYSLEGKASACNAGDLGSTPGSGRSLMEGNGYSLQYSCLRTSSEPSYIVGQLTLWCLPVSLSFIPEAGQGLKSHLGHSPVHFELRRGNPVLCLPSISFVNLTKSVSHSSILA